MSKKSQTIRILDDLKVNYDIDDKYAVVETLNAEKIKKIRQTFTDTARFQHGIYIFYNNSIIFDNENL